MTSWKDEEEAGGGACRAAGKQATSRARGRVPRRAMEKKEKREQGRRWMPRLREATKDVTSCDKPGVGANTR